MPSYRSSSQHSNNNSGYGYSKSNQQEKPVNVSLTLHGPVSKDQLYKIQEVLRHPSQYGDRIKPKDCPVKGEYVTAFNKFCPKKVEVNEATVKEAIKYGQFLRPSIYIRHWATKCSTVQKKIQMDQHEQPHNDYQPSMLQKKYFSSVITSAPRQLDCFTIALGKKTGTTFLLHSITNTI